MTVTEEMIEEKIETVAVTEEMTETVITTEETIEGMTDGTTTDLFGPEQITQMVTLVAVKRSK